MYIKPLFTSSQIEKLKEKMEHAFETAMIELLVRVGEEFVKIAREQGNYQDRTGNLRSSIGYAIAVNGKIVNENFSLSEEGSDKNTGLATAQRLCETIAGENATGYILIGVAGMNYAAKVEASGRDVVGMAAVKAEEKAKTLARKLANKLGI